MGGRPSTASVRIPVTTMPKRMSFFVPTISPTPSSTAKLQSVLDDENSDIKSRQMLLMIIRISRHILNEGVPVRQLVELGTFLRTDGNGCDATLLERWLKSLKLQPVARLEASLLIMLLGFSREEISFAGAKDDKRTELIAHELMEFANTPCKRLLFLSL